MKSSRLSSRDLFLLLFLIVLVGGVVYYMAFYTPLQNDLANIATQSTELDDQINIGMAQVASMDAMQAELDEIFARPENEITEIAPYDNAKVVMTELNNILASSLEYKLSFSDPNIEADGTVRRAVTMTFRCNNYSTAKSIIQQLASSHWRCLITSLSLTSDDNISNNEVQVSASITFFESTNLS